MKYYQSIKDYESLKTQKQKIEFCRKILHKWSYKYNNEPLCNSDHAVMLHVFNNHVCAHTKKLDQVHQIFVQRSVASKRSFVQKNFCFHLQYKDGTTDDISFMKCIGKHNKEYRKKEKRSDFITVAKIEDRIPTKTQNLEHAILNRSIPECAGVYFIWQNCELIYIGESGNLRNRLIEDESHLYTDDPHKKYLNYIKCNSKGDARRLEVEFIRILTPKIKTLKNNCSIAKKSLRDSQELA